MDGRLRGEMGRTFVCACWKDGRKDGTLAQNGMRMWPGKTTTATTRKNTCKQTTNKPARQAGRPSTHASTHARTHPLAMLLRPTERPAVKVAKPAW